MPLSSGEPRDDAAALLLLVREGLALGYARDPDLVEDLHARLSEQLSEVASGEKTRPAAALLRALQIIDDATE